MAEFPPGLHYHLSCYVLGKASVQPSRFSDWATFSAIFNGRPDGCRFAIGRKVPLVAVQVSPDRVVAEVGLAPEGDWLCWNLLDDELIKLAWTGGPLLRAPAPIWTSPSESGLIMKAMALYDR